MGIQVQVRPPTIQLDKAGRPLTGLKNHYNGQHSICWQGFKVGMIAEDREHVCFAYQLSSSLEVLRGGFGQCKFKAQEDFKRYTSHSNSQGPVVLLKVNYADTKYEYLRRGVGANFKNTSPDETTMVTLMASDGEMFDVSIPEVRARQVFEGRVYDHRLDRVSECHTLGDIK